MRVSEKEKDHIVHNTVRAVQDEELLERQGCTYVRTYVYVYTASYIERRGSGEGLLFLLLCTKRAFQGEKRRSLGFPPFPPPRLPPPPLWGEREREGGGDDDGIVQGLFLLSACV